MLKYIGKFSKNIILTFRVHCVQPSTCKMCDVTMPEREIDLKPGRHTIRVTIDTLDEHFHNNAYFRITFAVKQKDVCKSCECPGIR